MLYFCKSLSITLFIILAFGNAKTHIHNDASRFVSN